MDKLRKKYAPKVTSLKERLRKAQATVEREKEQARQSGLQTAISIGATLLGAFTGRKGVSGATTAARGVGRSLGERQDIGRAEDTVESIQKLMNDLNAEFQAESANISANIDPSTEQLESATIKPKKADIVVQLVALVWAPYWQDETGSIEKAF